MRGVKTPEERGPIAWWAYRTGRQLSLSVEQIAHALDKNAGTIRKAESDSRNMSRPLLRELWAFYQRIAREKGIAIDPPPDPSVANERDSDVAAAIDRQTVAIQRQADFAEKQLSVLEEIRDRLRPAVDWSPEEREAILELLGQSGWRSRASRQGSAVAER